jgi:hypothetical protein
MWFGCVLHIIETMRHHDIVFRGDDVATMAVAGITAEASEVKRVEREGISGGAVAF